jgi:hypothetical protein
MEKEFIHYEQALALKELGFDEPCFGFYNNADGNVWIKHTIDESIKNIYIGDFEAPTFSQAFRWFREKYKVYMQHDSVLTGHSQGHRFILKDSAYLSIVGTTWCKTYEEAELECLKKLIENTII